MNPSLPATERAIVLFPAPAGPSIATIIGFRNFPRVCGARLQACRIDIRVDVC
jgi:hypothetical protein